MLLHRGDILVKFSASLNSSPQAQQQESHFGNGGGLPSVLASFAGHFLSVSSLPKFKKHRSRVVVFL